MIRTLNRLYWIAYLGVVAVLFWIFYSLLGARADNALVSAIGLVFGVLFLAHLGFNAAGFVLNASVSRLPRVRNKGLAHHQLSADQSLHRLGPWGWTKALLKESIGSMRLITVYQPWAMSPEGIRLGGKPWRKTKPLPVLLVHGYLCNAAVWAPTRALLDRAEVTSHAITLEPAIGSIRSYADAIDEAITDLLVATGAPQVKVIAHSMGGVAMRYHATEYGHDRIAGMITLGSPHFGTALSTLGVGKNVRQMAWGSFFLRKLAEHPVDRAFQEKIVSIWSAQDNIVCPPQSSLLQFGKNINLSGCGHVGLISDSTTQDLILNWLAEDAQAYPLAENRA